MLAVRVLFSSLSGIGHINPLVPLAHALAEADHDVHWATGPESCARSAHRRRFPTCSSSPGPGGPTSSCTTPPSRRADRGDGDGVAHVTHAFGALPAPRVALGAEAVAPLWEAQGLQPRPYAGSYDHSTSTSIRPRCNRPAAITSAAVGTCGPSRSTARPDDAASEITQRLGRPLVYLTFGTFFGDNPAFRAALAGIRELGVGLVSRSVRRAIRPRSATSRRTSSSSATSPSRVCWARATSSSRTPVRARRWRRSPTGFHNSACPRPSSTTRRPSPAPAPA
jgi:hypothetical protein